MRRWPSTIPRCMGKNKRRQLPPSATSRAEGRRDIPIQEQASPDQQKPSWRFGRFDAECVEWGEKTLQANIHKVLEGLKSYEDLPWQEIKQAPHGKNGKTKNHSVGLEGLTKEARKRLNKIKNDDIVEVFSLRLESMFRIIGIRDGAILNVLWIDPDHKVCKTSH